MIINVEGKKFNLCEKIDFPCKIDQVSKTFRIFAVETTAKSGYTSAMSKLAALGLH